MNLSEKVQKLEKMRKNYYKQVDLLWNPIRKELDIFMTNHTIEETIEESYKIGFDCVPRLLYIRYLETLKK
jgi:hypothetical protein